MVKVNVLSNLLLIYRKFVNYGYLFVLNMKNKSFLEFYKGFIINRG